MFSVTLAGKVGFNPRRCPSTKDKGPYARTILVESKLSVLGKEHGCVDIRGMM